jgi:hypothetical protein
MNVDDLLRQSRNIWPESMSEQEIAIAMGVIYGDICRYVRDHTEDKQVDEAELKKELGNMIFSSLRWCVDLGFSPEECIKLAIETQKKYQSK